MQLSPEELEDFWALQIPVEAEFLSDDEITLAIAEGRVKEAWSTSSMGTAETYWTISTDPKRAREAGVVLPPGQKAEETPYEDRLDDRHVIEALWEPFHRAQEGLALRGLPPDKRSVFAGECARLLVDLGRQRLVADDPRKALDAVIKRVRGLKSVEYSLKNRLRFELVRLLVRLARGCPWSPILLEQPGPRPTLRLKELPVPPRREPISIDRCAICARIDQSIELDYEQGDVRPAILDRLETLVTTRTEDDDGAWRERSVVVCPSCSTFYRRVRSKDEGRSFMDPTHDTEALERLTILAALDALDAPRTRSARDRLSGRALEVIGALEALLVERRAPSWHLLQHAVMSVLEHCLVNGDLDRLERTLLRHSDPIVRVEAAIGLLGVVVDRGLREGSLYEAAKRFVKERSPVPLLRQILAEPAAKTFRHSRDCHGYRETDTHERAVHALAQAGRAELRFDDATIERLADLVAGENEAHRFKAAWALLFAIDHNPGAVTLLRPRLDALPPEVQSAPVVSMLAGGVRRRSSG